MIRETRRVLFINPAAQRGGSEAGLINIIRHTPPLTYRFIVVLLARGPLASELRLLGVRVYVIPAGRFRYMGKTILAIYHIARLALKEKVSLLSSAGTKGHIYAAFAATIARRPAVWRLQDVPKHRDKWATLARWLPTSGMTADSHAALDAYRRINPAPHVTAVIYPGADFTTLTPTNHADTNVRRDLGIPLSLPIVAIVGRLQRWKGQHLFIEAAAQVLRSGRSAHFLVVGDALFGIESGYPEELKALAKRLGLKNNVTFTGFISDVGHVLQDIDILVHASISPEPFGTVIVEGMSLGKAVVASAAGGPLEIIDDGSNGLLTPPDDAKALAHAIISLLDDPKQRERLGEAAQLTVQSRFTAQQMAAGYIRFYDAVLARENH